MRPSWAVKARVEPSLDNAKRSRDLSFDFGGNLTFVAFSAATSYA
jgi:hypothetical protein